MQSRHWEHTTQFWSVKPQPSLVPSSHNKRVNRQYLNKPKSNVAVTLILLHPILPLLIVSWQEPPVKSCPIHKAPVDFSGGRISLYVILIYPVKHINTIVAMYSTQNNNALLQTIIPFHCYYPHSKHTRGLRIPPCVYLAPRINSVFLCKRPKQWYQSSWELTIP